MQKSKKTMIPARVIAVAAALVLLCSAALAAGVLLRPSEVAQQFGGKTLSAAFDSESAVNINETVTSGDYTFTLLAVVSGKDLTDLPYGDSTQADRTYAVLAIQKADGTPMTKEYYEDVSFMATPLVKGLEPWAVNIATMNGRYTEDVVDGVLYRLIECDSVAMFADRGLYIGVCTEIFINNNTFLFDETAGEISVNPDYQGASAIFDLPLDESLADPEQADYYLEHMFDSSDDGADFGEESLGSDIDWEQAVPIDSTFQELTVDSDGYLTYNYECEYASGMITHNVDELEEWFTENQTADFHIFEGTDSNGNEAVYAVRFDQTETGGYTAVVVTPAES